MGEPINVDSALTTEAAACRFRTKMAVRQRYTKVIVETDSEKMFKYITSEHVQTHRTVKPYLQDIVENLKRIPEWKFSQVKSQANAAADWVATQIRRGICIAGCIRQPPSDLAHILNKDVLPAPPGSQ